MIRPGTLALAVLGGLIALRIWTLIPPAPAPGDAPGEVQTLFDDLARSGRLTVGARAQLVLPEPDLALAAAARGEPLDADTQRLLRDLDGSAAGVALRSQITLWNRGRRLSAVRDDGAAVGAPGTKSERFSTFRRLKVGWRAHDCTLVRQPVVEGQDGFGWQ